MDLTHAVFVGLDVGKGEHHATALDPIGKRLHDGTLPNDEARLRQLFDKLGEHGPVLVVVDRHRRALRRAGHPPLTRPSPRRTVTSTVTPTTGTPC